MKSYLYKTEEGAKSASKELGCVGFHKHKRKTFMPCKSHSEFKKLVNNIENDSKEELGELIDFDGTMNNSQVPIIDPRTSDPGLSTMDKRVASGHQTQDPLTRGYRVYYGESVVREEDMSGAFGYEETSPMSSEETIDYFINLDFDPKDAKDRASEMGKDIDIPVNKEIEKEEGEDFIETMRLVEKEFTKEQIMKMAEDSLVLKSDEKGFTKKDLKGDKSSPVIKRNIKALKNMADVEGISVPDLIKMLKNE